MKRGFTLVELSIVLVIIGLLIGAIVVAQSMVSTAKIEKVVKQLSQYDVAIANFRTKFNQLPGDTTLFTPAGNNDGNVNYGEGMNAWVHLSEGVGLLNSQGTSYQYLAWPATTRTAVNCPMFDLNVNSANGLCLNLEYQPAAGHVPLRFNYYAGLNDYSTTADSMLAIDAAAIDTKIDDGNANTGNFIAQSIGYGHANPYDWWECADSSTGKYKVTNTAYMCTPYISVGISNGTIYP